MASTQQPEPLEKETEKDVPARENGNGADIDKAESQPKTDLGSSADTTNPFFLDKDGKPQKRKGLPPILDHFNWHDLKHLFKATLAVWIFFVFMMIQPILRAYGTATFFGCIVLFIVPSSGIALLQLLMTLTMLIGMGLGWAWGVITMKAALSTRPESETQARFAQLQANYRETIQNADQASGQSEYVLRAVYDGFMLDTRISITYIGMGCIFIFTVYRLRAVYPKLILFAMFGGIIINLFLVIAPLFPTFRGTLAKILVVPAATAAGLGFVCNILFFPESTSKVALEGMVNVLKPMKPFLNAMLISLEQPQTRFDMKKLQGTKVGMIMQYKQLEASLGFLKFDFAFCRWKSADIISMKEDLRLLMSLCIGLVALQINRLEAEGRIRNLKQLEDELKKNSSLDDSSSGQTKVSKSSTVGAHQLALALDVRHKLHHPESDGLLWQSLAVLLTTSGPIIQTCCEALDATTDAFENVNNRRWFRRLSPSACEGLAAKHEEVLERLKLARQEFSDNATRKLLDPHMHLFDAEGKLMQPSDEGLSVPLHGLLIGLMYEERVLGFSNGLIKLLSRVVELERKRTKVSFWPPTGIRHFFAWAFDKERAPASTNPGDLPHNHIERVVTTQMDKNAKKAAKEAKKGKVKTETQQQLEGLRFQGGRKRGPGSKVLLKAVHWLGSDATLFALRVVIVTIAFATFANCTATAGFFYREKGLWAIIMAQFTLAIYTADFTFGLLLRGVGTVLGGILGLLVWYIGSADGPGSPYGLSAIFAVFAVIFMWFRLFSPPAVLPGIMISAATMIIVIAYSWDDTHIPSYGNPGVGYNVFWRRTVLVLVGLAVAAITMFFPRPPSANRHYRQVLAGVLRRQKDMYALFVAAWRNPHEDLVSTAESEAISNGEAVGGILGPLQLLKFEFSTSAFDAPTLTKICVLCQTVNTSLMQLFHFSAKLPDNLKQRFARLTNAFEESLVGDIMAVLTMCELSVKTGDPLPALLPTPLIARSLGLQSKLFRLSVGEDVVTTDMVLDEDFRKYCCVMGAFVQNLAAIDELVMAIKSACGETHVVDVESWPLLEDREDKAA